MRKFVLLISILLNQSIMANCEVDVDRYTSALVHQLWSSQKKVEHKIRSAAFALELEVEYFGIRKDTAWGSYLVDLEINGCRKDLDKFNHFLSNFDEYR